MPPAADVPSTTTSASVGSAGRESCIDAPVEVSLWVRQYASTSACCITGTVPGADSITIGSPK